MELGIQVTCRVIHGVLFAARIMSLVYSIEDPLECNDIIRRVPANFEIGFDAECVKHDLPIYETCLGRQIYQSLGLHTACRKNIKPSLKKKVLTHLYIMTSSF